MMSSDESQVWYWGNGQEQSWRSLLEGIHFRRTHVSTRGLFVDKMVQPLEEYYNLRWFGSLRDESGEGDKATNSCRQCNDEDGHVRERDELGLLDYRVLGD
ncbi:Uncharacterized protein Fot_21610 [Forsythia ovata]|uniref:Uncharacterized protein n=1 Tax=Forsythia ovata TaxID=205694 RepID=A0ABD1UVH6_9LAMI